MNSFPKNIYLINWIIWLILFLALALITISSGSGKEAMLFFPGAQCIALASLSITVIESYPFLISKEKFLIKNFIAAGIFGISFLIVSILIILFGEKLLKLPEHYTLAELTSSVVSEWPVIIIGILCYFIIFSTLSLLHFRRLYYVKQQEIVLAQETLKSSSLETLALRLHPHFLFNAMNNINMLIRKNENKKAIDMSAALSGLLRRSMSTDPRTTISLDEELNYLNEYIALEMLRHEDFVKVEINVNENAGNPQLPQMLLQPLLENAFKYGELLNPETAKIFLDIYKKEESLVISVYNNGNFDTSWNLSSNKGIGLNHSIHRLHQLYGSGYSFKIKEEKQGVRMLIKIPHHE